MRSKFTTAGLLVLLFPGCNVLGPMSPDHNGAQTKEGRRR